MTAPTLPLLTSDVVTWLEALLPDEKVFQGPKVPRFPGAMLVVSPTQGAGLSMEFAFDQVGFQIHAVGPQSRDGRVNGSMAAAERLMYLADRTLLMHAYPTSIAGHHVTHAQRFGSGPSPLPDDDGGRSHLVCTYLMQAETGYAR